MSENCCSSDCTIPNDPDCVKCLHRKLNASNVVVFFKDGDAWRVGNFQGDRPSDAAEVDFNWLLKNNFPEIILQLENGLIYNKSEDFSFDEKIAKFFEDKTLVARPVSLGNKVGIRAAWRELNSPYIADDLELLLCESDCPEGC